MVKKWRPRQDLNLHPVKDMNLNHARLPIPPRGPGSLKEPQCGHKLSPSRKLRMRPDRPFVRSNPVALQQLRVFCLIFAPDAQISRIPRSMISKIHEFYGKNAVACRLLKGLHLAGIGGLASQPADPTTNHKIRKKQ